jgi:hypothetical protein
LKVLLDEDLPHELRHHLPGHDVYTVRYLRWDSLKNGTLLRTAEDGLFDVFVTGDQNLTSQQSMKGRKIGVVTLTAQRLDQLLRNLGAIRAAVDAAAPGSVQVVKCVELS